MHGFAAFLGIFCHVTLCLAAMVSGVDDHRHHQHHQDPYLVLLKPDATPVVRDFHSYFVENLSMTSTGTDHPGKSDMKWFSFEENGVIVYGYSASMDVAALNVLRRDPSVDLVEYDAPVRIMGGERITDVQHNAPWGLVRSSHRNISVSNDFIYKKNDGEGVDVYVVDTGVFVEHDDFDGRAIFGKSFIYDGKSEYQGEVRKDDNGHGTHCAGTIAGNRYGVCKRCKIIAVKVLDHMGTGRMSGVIGGIEWSVKNAKTNKRPSVISMSLGGGFSYAMNRAVEAAVAAGVHVVVAAGNSYADSCESSPASSDKVITVGAIDHLDVMASFSNYGECVNIFAPGVNVESAWITGKNSSTVLSGTSMATPHVAGVVGALLSRKVERDPKKLLHILQTIASKDVVKEIPNDLQTVNLLLFNGVDDGDESNEATFDDVDDDVDDDGGGRNIVDRVKKLLYQEL